VPDCEVLHRLLSAGAYLIAEEVAGFDIRKLANLLNSSKSTPAPTGIHSSVISKKL